MQYPPRRPAFRLIAATLAAVIMSLACRATAEPSDDARAQVYAADGVLAEAHTDCDETAFTLVTLSSDHDAERYAKHERFAEKIAAHLTAIIDASADWLDGAGAAACEETSQAETVTLVGLVNALPVYASAASRDHVWAPGSATADARDLARFAALLPPAGAVRCEDFAAAVEPEIGKTRTRTFTVRVARSTGQWSYMQSLTYLIPLHQKVMGWVGEWGLEWTCPDIASLIELAVIVDEERAALLRDNERAIFAELDQADSPAAIEEILTTTYRTRDFPPVTSFLDLASGGEEGTAPRYGGYRSPVVERLEAAVGALTSWTAAN